MIQKPKNIVPALDETQHFDYLYTVMVFGMCSKGEKTGMPSKVSQLMLSFMRDHPSLFRSSKTSALMELEPSPQTIENLKMGGTRVQMICDAAMPAMWITPRRDAQPRKVLLHLHGGAYVSGGLLQAHAVIAPICAKSGIRALTFAYRLAPEFPYPAQLDDALTMYRYLLSLGYKGDDIALVGESAGGNLALALTLKLRALSEPLPACLCLLSPWCDLRQTGESYERNKALDATLDAQALLKNAIEFAGGDEKLLDDPMLCPLKADFSGFPPTQIHCGTSELLQSDSRTLRDRMNEFSVPVQLIEWEGMCHVFQIFRFEESRLSIKMMAAFLGSMLGAKSPVEEK